LTGAFHFALGAGMIMTCKQTAGIDNEIDPPGAHVTRYQVLAGSEWSSVTGAVIQETLVSIFANGQEIATMMATPQHQEYLAVGYLFTEGLIHSQADILHVSLAPNRSCVDVLLKKQEIALPPRRVLTSGCGKGVTYMSYSDATTSGTSEIAQVTPATSDLQITPEQIQCLVQAMQQASHLHRRAGGVHAAALASPSGLVTVMEDIGRHNTLDKLAGYCLLNDIESADHILLTTGRISSEMVHKALRMQLPVIASLTSPTSLSVDRAEAWNLTLIGYVRPHRMHVYTHPERLVRTGDHNEV
jgi:FdhD protein